MKEEWRNMVTLEAKFEVSNLGRIRSKYQHGLTKGNLRKPYIDKLGYCWVSYGENGKQKKFSIHRAVATTFIPNPLDKPYVNHIDSNPSNNHLDNLEWVTGAENVEHSRTLGNADRYQNRGSGHGMSKLTEAQVRDIKQLKGVQSGIKTAKQFTVDDQTIYDIWNGKRWKHVQ